MTAALHRLAALLLIGLAAGSVRSATAQGVTAQVSGVVVDALGGVVPGVTVTITNADTGWRREMLTSSSRCPSSSPAPSWARRFSRHGRR